VTNDAGTLRAELASDYRRPPAHADPKHCGCLLLTRDYIVLHGAVRASAHELLLAATNESKEPCHAISTLR